MSQIGAFEAKTHLPRLLERVQKGELALRFGLPLATLDRKLGGACNVAGVEILPAR